MSNKTIPRIFHRFEKWEDSNNGMYDNKNDDGTIKSKCIELLSNKKLFLDWALKVIEEWKYSTEENLSQPNMNRMAWIGQASCCMYCGASDNITKDAWNELTPKQQKEASLIAETVIKIWESNYEK